MRTLAPGSPTLVLAENEFTNSKLVEETKAKASADQEAKVKQQAQALSALIDDPSQSVPVLEQALAGFLERAGTARPERPELERKLEDRRQQLVVVAALAALDGVMARGDRAALAPLVTDSEFAKALGELMAYPGLVFESRLDGFTRRDSQATAKVSLRHALAVYPERRLSYVYELKRESQGWTIASAKLQP